MGKNLERPAEGKVLIMFKRKLLILLLSFALVFSSIVDASLEEFAEQHVHVERDTATGL